MILRDSQTKLLAMACLLILSFLFAVISMAGHWSSSMNGLSLLQHNEAIKKALETDTDTLWLIGCAVLILLGIICICVSCVILLARFFNQGRGKAILGGVLSIFAGAVFIIALAIFMANQEAIHNHHATYTYGFALLWIAVPCSIAAGILFFLLEDDSFLTSELEYSASSSHVHE